MPCRCPSAGPRACASVLLVLLGVASGLPARAEVSVVATLPDLAALSAEVGGEHVHVVALVGPDQDPHFVDARPSLMVKLHQADLLVTNGLQLEIGWLPTLLVGARNPAIQPGSAGHLDASRAIRPLEVPASVDRARGDIHPGGNPHYLRDPRAAAAVARVLGDALSALDPAHAADYHARAAATAVALEAFAAQQHQRFAALPASRRAIIPYHRSLAYLRDWLGLTAPLTVEPLPGIAPTPSHVAKVLQTIRAEGLRAVVAESYYPRKTSESVASLGHVELVVIPGGAAFQSGGTYLETAKETADALYAALSR